MAHLLVFSGSQKRARHLAARINCHTITVCSSLEDSQSILEDTDGEPIRSLIIDAVGKKAGNFLSALGAMALPRTLDSFLLVVPEDRQDTLGAWVELVASICLPIPWGDIVSFDRKALATQDLVTSVVDLELLKGWLMQGEDDTVYPFDPRSTLLTDQRRKSFFNPGLCHFVRMLAGRSCCMEEPLPWEALRSCIDWELLFDLELDLGAVFQQLGALGQMALTDPSAIPFHFFRYDERLARSNLSLQKALGRLIAAIPDEEIASVN
ncbi:MAG: hypothetical protein H6760_01255 [Candidatus Nomurabacteria bacterium]|nr:MAG: hypothetical protein H6760_01255 [Candidatus Nomurabacteria bacterium]